MITTLAAEEQASAKAEMRWGDRLCRNCPSPLPFRLVRRRSAHNSQVFGHPCKRPVCDNHDHLRGLQRERQIDASVESTSGRGQR